ncbi:DUF6076 domain-containing protein [Muricomes intestini]|uniref:DUF6076 domain-containing protein n=1 Tax=Muricomes intestini TaxID=1796634 RepID=UPI002695C911
MEITYPFAKVFTDSTNKFNVFFLHDAEHSTFQQIGEIGTGIVDFCELDFSELQEKIKALETVEVTNANFEDIKKVYWNAVELLKEKHSYLHFFLTSDLFRNFYNVDRSEVEKVSYANFLFQYYLNLQAVYAEALEFCLSNEILSEYTLPERYVMFCNLYPNFMQYMLRSMYGIAPIANGRFDTNKLISFNDPDEVDTRKVLQNIHRDSKHAVSMWQYFAIQSLEEMFYLEFMEMTKRGIRIKRCGLCDRYFVLADKRKRDYCDRIYKGKRTCKQIGAKQKFNQSVEQDSFLQEFQRIYNRMYSRYYRMDAWDSDRQTNKMTEEQFKAWISAASKARQEYKAGVISGRELLKRIDRSKNP